MSSSAQSSTRSTESIVISKPLERVWDAVKPLNLEFWKAVKSTKVEGDANAVGTSTRTLEFKDGSTQNVRLVELSELNFTASYELMSANPAPPYLSALHTIQCHRVTEDNTTFVSWTSEFSSSSGGQELVVTEDSRYKRKEALSDLKKSLEGSN